MKRINIYEEANRCLMCQEAPCTKACKTGDPARAVRAIRFDNHKLATRWVADCSDADLEAAEEAITFDTATRQPHIVGTKCVGCHLCRIVCPSGAIGVTNRIPKK